MTAEIPADVVEAAKNAFTKTIKVFVPYSGIDGRTIGQMQMVDLPDAHDVTARAIMAERERSKAVNAELLEALKDMLPPKLTWKERDADGFLVHHKVAAINATRAAIARAEGH